jgi:hypothetical protein
MQPQLARGHGVDPRTLTKGAHNHPHFAHRYSQPTMRKLSGMSLCLCVSVSVSTLIFLFLLSSVVKYLIYLLQYNDNECFLTLACF